MSLDDLPRCERCGDIIYELEEYDRLCVNCLSKDRCERCGDVADLYSEVTGEWLCLDCYEEELGLKVDA